MNFIAVFPSKAQMVRHTRDQGDQPFALIHNVQTLVTEEEMLCSLHCTDLFISFIYVFTFKKCILALVSLYAHYGQSHK